MNKIFKSLLAIMMICSIIVTSVVSVSAADNELKVNEQPIIVQGNGYISESYNFTVKDTKISVVRISYDNNTSVWCVEENGIKTSWVVESDYGQIRENVIMEKSIKQYDSGYRYVYITTKTDTQHVTPKNGTYSAILSAVSMAIGMVNAPAGLATGIAALIFGLNSSSVECWITNTRHFYEVYDATGSYLGYYKMNYTVVTEAIVNGKRQEIDRKSGSSESLYIF